MLCPNCGKEVSEGKKFCGHCGQKLISPAPVTPDFDDEAPTRMEDVERPLSAGKMPEPESPVPDSSPCPVCGRLNRSGALFCDGCGTNLIDLKATQADPAGQEQQVVHLVQQAAQARVQDSTHRSEKTREINRPAWQPVLLIALGWAFGCAIGHTLSYLDIFLRYPSPIAVYFHLQPYHLTYIRWLVAWITSGLIGGVITGLALRRVKPVLGWKQILIITFGWVIGYVLLFLTGLLLKINVPLLFGQVEWWETYLVTIWIIGGFTGGSITGLVLNEDKPPRIRKPVAVITTGWVAGWIVFLLIYYFIRWVLNDPTDNYLSPSQIDIAALFALTGAIAGAIGGWVMLWQLSQASQEKG